MRDRRASHIVLLFVATSLRAADVVALTDGDRLTGTIQKLEKGKLFFKSKYSETPLEIDWTLVSGLTTESEMKMTLRNGTETTGAVTAIHLSTLVALQPKPDEQVEKSSAWLKRAWKNSTVSADFDQSYSGLAQYNQLSSNSEIQYKGDRWDGLLINHFDYYGATDSARSTYQAYGRFVAQRYLRGDHFFLFPYAFLGRQTTSDGGSGQIRQYGGGAGWTFRRHRSDQMSIFAGLVKSRARGFAIDSEEAPRRCPPQRYPLYFRSFLGESNEGQHFHKCALVLLQSNLQNWAPRPGNGCLSQNPTFRASLLHGSGLRHAGAKPEEPVQPEEPSAFEWDRNRVLVVDQAAVG